MFLSFAMVMMGIVTLMTLISLSSLDRKNTDGSRPRGNRLRRWGYRACIAAIIFGVINGIHLGAEASPEYIAQKLEVSNDPECLLTHLTEKARKEPLNKEHVRVAVSICSVSESKKEKPLRLRQLDTLENFTSKDLRQ